MPSDPSLGLQPYVARVLSSLDPESLAGTAFLFRCEGSTQYWFTCHHVVMSISELYVGYDRNGKCDVRAATYVPEQSSPHRDIAVLKTEVFEWKTLTPLKLGDPFAHRTQIPPDTQVLIYGYQKPRTTVGACDIHSPFRRLSAHRYRLSGLDALPPVPMANPWNCVIAETTDLSTYELTNGVHLAQGLSGAPVCYLTLDDTYACLGMFAQIWHDVQGVARDGVAVRFQDLHESARDLIPFYPYADCLIITVAATQQEMLAAHKTLPPLPIPLEDWLSLARPEYYGSNRDGWQPFGTDPGDQPNVLTLLQISDLAETWQVVSSYIDAPNAIADALDYNFPGVVFLLDPCSLCLDALAGIIHVANDTHWKASYLILCCEQRVDGPGRRDRLLSLVKTTLPKIEESPYLYQQERSEFVAKKPDFTKRLQTLVRSTVAVGLANWSTQPIGRERLQRLSKAFGNAANPFPVKPSTV